MLLTQLFATSRMTYDAPYQFLLFLHQLSYSIMMVTFQLYQICINITELTPQNTREKKFLSLVRAELKRRKKKTSTKSLLYYVTSNISSLSLKMKIQHNFLRQKQLPFHSTLHKHVRLLCKEDKCVLLEGNCYLKS